MQAIAYIQQSKSCRRSHTSNKPSHAGDRIHPTKQVMQAIAYIQQTKSCRRSHTSNKPSHAGDRIHPTNQVMQAIAYIQQTKSCRRSHTSNKAQCCQCNPSESRRLAELREVSKAEPCRAACCTGVRRKCRPRAHAPAQPSVNPKKR